MATIIRSRPWRLLALLAVSAVALLMAGPGQLSPVSADTLCQPGIFSATGSEPCSPCPPGKFAPEAGATSCTECAPGTFSAGAGAVQCTQCSPGKFSVGSGAAACAECVPGTFAADGGSSACESCPPGEYVFATGSTSCVPCALWTGTRSVKFTKVLADPVAGNDALKVVTQLPVSGGFASLDPGATGARVIVQGAGQDILLDAVLPAGDYGGRDTRGWELRKKGRQWLYKDSTALPIAGIVSVAVDDLDRVAPGTVRVTITGKDGDYPVEPGDSPLRTVIAFDDATAPLCGDGGFTLDDCFFNGSQKTLTCKAKGS